MSKDEHEASLSSFSEMELSPGFEVGGRPTLPLGKHKLTIEMDGTTSKVDADLALSFASFPRIVAKFEEPFVEGWFWEKLLDGKCKVYLAENSNAPAKLLQADGENAQVYWEKPKLAGSSCNGVWYVTFYIMNFTSLPKTRKQ